MGLAFGWGQLAASSLLIGGPLALHVGIGNGPARARDGVRRGRPDQRRRLRARRGGRDVGRRPVVALGFFAGALIFFAGDALIDRRGGSDRKARAGSRRAGHRSRSCSASSSTASPSRSCSACPCSRGRCQRRGDRRRLPLEPARGDRRDDGPGEGRLGARPHPRPLDDRRAGLGVAALAGYALLRRRVAAHVAFMLAFAAGRS